MEEVRNRGGNLSPCFVWVWNLGFTQTPIWIPFYWTQRMLEVLSLEAIWNFTKGTGFPWLGHQIMGPKRRTCIGMERAQTHLLFYSIHFTHIHEQCYMAAVELGLFWRLVTKPSEVLLKQMCGDNPTMNESYMDNATIDTGFILKWTVYIYLTRALVSSYVWFMVRWALMKEIDKSTDYKISVYRTWTCINLVTEDKKCVNW